MTKPAAATNTAAADGQLTSDEAKQLERAFQDEAFRKLLADYVSELSDPKHRAEQEGGAHMFFLIVLLITSHYYSTSQSTSLFRFSLHQTAGRPQRITIG